MSGQLLCVQVSSDCLTVGAAVSLSNLIRALEDNQSSEPKFKSLADHLYKVFNIS